MLGYGLAGAVSPYLGVVLRNQDPRLPFVISGVVLLLTTLALSKVEQGIAEDPAAKPAAPAKAAKRRADVLHRLDGHSLARLSTAFRDQQHAVLSALRRAQRAAVADAGVLDRLQHRDVSGERHRQASRRVDRDGRRRPARRAGRAGRRDGRQSPHPHRRAVPGRRGLGLHADERGIRGARDRRDRRRGQGGRAGVFRAGAGDLCADGGGRGRPAKAAGIRAAAAMGAGGVLGGGGRGPAGDRGDRGCRRVWRRGGSRVLPGG